MRTKIVEGATPDGLYLKAMVCRFDDEDWRRRSIVGHESGYDISLLRQEGWTARHFVILDLSTPGPGQIFYMEDRPGRGYEIDKQGLTKARIQF